MNSIHLDIFNSHFEVSSNDPLILARLKLDFDNFLTTSSRSSVKLRRIQAFLQVPPWEKVPDISSLKQNETSIIYEEHAIRYNDYHNKALSIDDSNAKTSAIYSESFDLLHELTFLLILSKSGKEMDLKGLHKIHAMGIQLNESNLIFMANSKGGKSTHFLEFLKNENVKIYSDDTPVVNAQGHLYPFPFRIGLGQIDQIPSYIDANEVYSLKRRNHGEKFLVPIKAIKRSLAQYSPNQKTILIASKRSRSKTPQLIRVSPLKMFPYLVQHMVIGVGLPMILEYFLESGFKDIIKRFVIITKRTVAAIRLSQHSECYLFEASIDIESNCLMMQKLLSKSE